MQIIHCQLKMRGILIWVYHGLAGFVAQLRICFLSENDSNLLSQFPGPQILTSTKINPFLFWIQFDLKKT